VLDVHETPLNQPHEGQFVGSASSRLASLTELIRGHLQLRVLLWIVVIPAPPLLLTVWFAHQYYADLSERVRGSAERLAGQTVTTLERVLHERERDSQFLSGLPAVRALDRPRTTVILNEAVRAYAPFYRLMLVAGTDGTVLAVNETDGEERSLRTRALMGRSLADQPWFRGSLGMTGKEGHSAPALLGGFQSDPLVREVSGSDLPVMRVTAPILSESGAVQGLWVAWVDGATIVNVLHAPSGERTPQPSFLVGLFDRDGRVLGFSEATPPQHAGTLLAERTMSAGGLDWRVRVFAEPAASSAGLPLSPYMILSVLGSIAAGAALLAWLVTRHILQPLEQVAKEAEIFAGTHRNRFTVEAGRRDTIGAVQRTLADMARELEAKTAALAHEAEEHRRSDQEARAAQRRLDLMLAQAPDLIVFTLPDGTVTRFNRGAERLLGFREAEMIGQSASRLYPHASDRDTLLAEVGEKGEVIAREVQLRSKDGRLVDVSLTLVPLKDSEGKTVGLVGFGKDIGELKRLERSLKTSNQELEHFTYTISHDLQTPLRAIHGFADLLLRRSGDRLDDKERHYLERMRIGADRMAALINDLLELSRIGRITYPFERFSTADVLTQALAELEPTIKASGATIHIERPLPVVLADRVRLLRVWVNLLSNAIKYAKPGETPVVTVGTIAPREGNGEAAWTFFVRDCGIGIAPEYHHQIFEVFRRLHTHEEYEGTGAGLAIVKRVVEFHGGRAWVESREGQGSTFWFTLPCASNGRQPSAISDQPARKEHA
jgi:PAS domain S-box-containing protein